MSSFFNKKAKDTADFMTYKIYNDQNNERIWEIYADLSGTYHIVDKNGLPIMDGTINPSVSKKQMKQEIAKIRYNKSKYETWRDYAGKLLRMKRIDIALYNLLSKYDNNKKQYYSKEYLRKMTTLERSPYAGKDFYNPRKEKTVIQIGYDLVGDNTQKSENGEIIQHIAKSAIQQYRFTCSTIRTNSSTNLKDMMDTERGWFDFTKMFKIKNQSSKIIKETKRKRSSTLKSKIALALGSLGLMSTIINGSNSLEIQNNHEKNQSIEETIDNTTKFQDSSEYDETTIQEIDESSILESTESLIKDTLPEEQTTEESKSEEMNNDEWQETTSPEINKEDNNNIQTEKDETISASDFISNIDTIKNLNFKIKEGTRIYISSSDAIPIKFQGKSDENIMRKEKDLDREYELSTIAIWSYPTGKRIVLNNKDLSYENIKNEAMTKGISLDNNEEHILIMCLVKSNGISQWIEFSDIQGLELNKEEKIKQTSIEHKEQIQMINLEEFSKSPSLLEGRISHNIGSDNMISAHDAFVSQYKYDNNNKYNVMLNVISKRVAHKKGKMTNSNNLNNPER